MKPRAPRNRTLTCGEDEIASFASDLLQLSNPATVNDVIDRVIHQDVVDAVSFLPRAFVDLLILDPPYNLTKDFNGNVFRAKEAGAYAAWFENMLLAVLPLLKSSASVYFCSDWRTSTLIFPVLERHLQVRNRIT
jgi:site-specific DNA-methyltransferase (adenine-specific)